MHWRRKWKPTPRSCLESSRDGGAWWAAISGVAQSRTRLKRLSSSSILLSEFTMATALLLFSQSALSDSLQPHGLQHTRLPCHLPISRSLLKLLSIESVMPSNHLVLCRPFLLPSIFPSDRETGWAAVYGVAQSRTRLKQLSSSRMKAC